MGLGSCAKPAPGGYCGYCRMVSSATGRKVLEFCGSVKTLPGNRGLTLGYHPLINPKNGRSLMLINKSIREQAMNQNPLISDADFIPRTILQRAAHRMSSSLILYSSSSETAALPAMITGYAVRCDRFLRCDRTQKNAANNKLPLKRD